MTHSLCAVHSWQKAPLYFQDANKAAWGFSGSLWHLAVDLTNLYIFLPSYNHSLFLYHCNATYREQFEHTFAELLYTWCDPSALRAVFIDRVLADSVEPHFYPSRNSSKHTDVRFDSLHPPTPPPSVSPSVMWKNYLLNITNVCYAQLEEYKFQSLQRAWKTAWGKYSADIQWL